jgi:hypothetical protein
MKFQISEYILHYERLKIYIYSMEYTALIPVLVEGMKEQQVIIEQLRQENSKQAELLQQQNTQLRASVEELEKLKPDVERIKEMFLVKE